MKRPPIAFVVTLLTAQLARGQDAKQPPLNLALPTLGGKQVWADQLFFHQWRVQQNVLTGHCRLLDGQDVRQAWGTYDQCCASLDGLKKSKKLPAMKGKAVIVLHGLMRSSASMHKLAESLRKSGEYQVFAVTYPSTKLEIADHAKNLAGIIDGLNGIEEINFVAHSLGNLIVRHYLADQTDAKSGKKPDARIKRIVMLAPPNQGAQLAERFGDQALVKAVFGEGAQQIAKFDKLKDRLATPACEFGIIAGGTGSDKGNNPLLPGDDDFVLTVAETKLPGARDFAVLPLLHNVVKDDARATQYTLRFLKHGYFLAPDKRQPIEK